MELKLIQVEDDINFKEFKLCNKNNEQIVSFDVELNKGTALLSRVFFLCSKKFR